MTRRDRTQRPRIRSRQVRDQSQRCGIDTMEQTKSRTESGGSTGGVVGACTGVCGGPTGTHAGLPRASSIADIANTAAASPHTSCSFFITLSLKKWNRRWWRCNRCASNLFRLSAHDEITYLFRGYPKGLRKADKCRETSPRCIHRPIPPTVVRGSNALSWQSVVST